MLYRPALRRLLLAVAASGAFRPVWSERLQAEWQRARLRAGAQAPDVAAEADALNLAWPSASMAEDPENLARVGALCRTESQRRDAHVVATALSAGAGLILTFNLADMPPRLLRPLGLSAEAPVAFAARLARAHPAPWLSVAAGWEGGAEAFLRPLHADLRLRRCAASLCAAAGQPGAHTGFLETWKSHTSRESVLAQRQLQARQ